MSFISIIILNCKNVHTCVDFIGKIKSNKICSQVTAFHFCNLIVQGKCYHLQISQSSVFF